MSSPTIIDRNRANAAHSTGPKTPEGKKKVALNGTNAGLRHGLLTQAPVVLGFEKEAAWNEHLAGTLDSLRPEGYIEVLLAERVASLFWRLGRVVRFEATELSRLREQAERDVILERQRAAALGVIPRRPADIAPDELAQETAWVQGKRLLLPAESLLKVQRYEAHLQRSLSRCLHELATLQARRLGEPTPVPTALDITISADQSQ